MIMSEVIKTRFCPSPTGYMHLGNIRTALFNALFAKGQKGQFLLRIEDTDRTRSDEKYTIALQEDMLWLGLNWDEGPNREGEAGPYRQSKRQDIYNNYYQILQEQDCAYPCFCTEHQLKVARKVQLASSKPPRYPGTCRKLSPEQVQEKFKQGLLATLRFKIPANKTIVFHDLLRGKQRFNTNILGDFIIRRTNGTPPFMYCNAIDDALMGVTHVLRGEDHLTNTPRQIMILEALDLPVPTYCHISLITGSDGSPLSKRHGSKSLQELRDEGYLPLALINYLARLGHYYKEEDLLSYAKLAQKFTIKGLSSSPARFDLKQMLYWQHQAMLHVDNDTLWQWMGDSVHQLVPVKKQNSFIKTIRPNITFPHDAQHWVQIIFGTEIGFNDEAKHILLNAHPDYFQTLLATFAKHGPDLEAIISALKTHHGLKGKALFQPLRIAVTGQLQGPELARIFTLMTPDLLKSRFEKAMSDLKT